MYDEALQTAYHEAGHMLAAWVLGLTVLGATIVPDEEAGYAGMVRIPIEDRVQYADWVNEREYLAAHLVTYLAGIAATEYYRGSPMSDTEIQLALDSDNDTNDYRQILNYLLELGAADEGAQEDVFNEAQDLARRIVGLRWEAVSSLAEILMERKTLDAAECREVLKRFPAT